MRRNTVDIPAVYPEVVPGIPTASPQPQQPPGDAPQLPALMNEDPAMVYAAKKSLGGEPNSMGSKGHVGHSQPAFLAMTLGSPPISQFSSPYGDTLLWSRKVHPQLWRWQGIEPYGATGFCPLSFEAFYEARKLCVALPGGSRKSWQGAEGAMCSLDAWCLLLFTFCETKADCRTMRRSRQECWQAQGHSDLNIDGACMVPHSFKQ